MKFALMSALLGAALTQDPHDDHISCMDGNYSAQEGDTRVEAEDCLYCMNGWASFGSERKDQTGQSKCMKKAFIFNYQRDVEEPADGCYHAQDPKMKELFLGDFLSMYMYLCFCHEGGCKVSGCYGSVDCPVPAVDQKMLTASPIMEHPTVEAAPKRKGGAKGKKTMGKGKKDAITLATGATTLGVAALYM